MIRHLTIDEIPLCVPFAEEFVKEHPTVGDDVVPDVFIENWRALYLTDQATIFSLWSEDGKVLKGGLGAIVMPDLFDGKMCANELFWFISKPYRGANEASELIQSYRTWAHASGAVRLRMVHFVKGPYAEILSRLYLNMGFEPVETVCQLTLT